MRLSLEEEADALAENLGTEEPEEAEVEDCDQKDAADEQEWGIVYPARGKIGHPDGGGGGEEEGEHVLQGREEGVADFLIEEAVPDACPEDDDGDVGKNHQVDS